MTESQHALVLAAAHFLAGLPCVLSSRRIAGWLSKKDGLLRGQPDVIVKAYDFMATERAIRWLGWILLWGAVLQLWASWIMF